MGRQSSPWYKPSHKAWYCRIDKRLIRLGRTKREATSAFHRLMADRGTTSRSGALLGFAELADLWLDDVRKRVKPRTWKSYREHAQSLMDAIGRVPVAKLSPRHITQWLAAHPGWRSKSTHHLAISIAKMITSWGATERNLTGMTTDPWAGVKRPPMGRRDPVSPLDLGRLVAGIRSEAFRDFVVLALETGCRPGELRTLEVRRVDFRQARATVTGKRGERIVHLSPRALELLRRLAKDHPIGPVLRNTQGKPWSERAVQDQFHRAGARVGVHVVPYHVRGLFATLALRRGVDSILVARLMGHSNTATLAKHYAAVEDDLPDAIRRATASGDA